jgi:F0F1-type ATP synthase alpha subunit
MSEQSVRPDVPSLLQALYEQASQLTSQVRFHNVGTVQRISDSVATFPGLPHVRPDAPSLLQALREQAGQLTSQARFHEIGIVQRVGDGVATLSGLRRARTGELLTFPTGVRGLILNLDHDLIDVILLGPVESIRGGDLVTSTGERLSVPVGHKLLGRVVNPLGEPLDERGPVDATAFHYLERDAPGIVERAPVDAPLHTGLKIVDALVPIGRGQRELDRGRAGAHRARAARTGRRRPADGQDNPGRGRHPQPAGQRCAVRLRRHRPEEILHAGRH